MNTLKRQKLVGSGGQGTVELVKVPEIAIKLVVKDFDNVYNNNMYNTISGEIECLLQVILHYNKTEHVRF